MLAIFDGPARAIRCASAITEYASRLDVEIRTGLHTGECEIVDGKVAGAAVEMGMCVCERSSGWRGTRVEHGEGSGGRFRNSVSRSVGFTCCRAVVSGDYLQFRKAVPETVNQTYPFADIDLARRLERTEAQGNVDFVEARAKAFPDRGATWIEVAGTYAMFDGVGSPLTQTFGLGAV